MKSLGLEGQILKERELVTEGVSGNGDMACFGHGGFCYQWDCGSEKTRKHSSVSSSLTFGAPRLRDLPWRRGGQATGELETTKGAATARPEVLGLRDCRPLGQL